MTTASLTPELPVLRSSTPVGPLVAGGVFLALVLAFTAAVAFGGTGDRSSDANTSVNAGHEASPPSPAGAIPETDAIPETGAMAGQQAVSTEGPLPLPYTDPNATIQVFDHGTAQLVTFTEKEWYDAALPYMPHPAGSLVVTIILENGAAKALYYEKVVTVERGPDGPIEMGTTGREVPFDEAQLRVDEEWRVLPPIPGLQRP